MSLREAGLLLTLAFFSFWTGSWNTPLFDLDEGAFSQATLEMRASGNYLTTTLDGEPRYDKPMLTYWLQGASISLLGETEFAFRLHSMLAATLWLWLVFTFVRQRESSASPAWLAAASLGLGLMPGIIGHAATADALLNLLLAATLLDLYRYYETPRRGIALRIFLWMGLGLLTKGPVAVAIPALVSGLFFVSQGRTREWLRGVFDWRGWLLLLALVLPWAIASWRSDGGAFLRHFLLDHNLGRYGSTMQGHGGHWYYYLVALPLIVLPFTALLPRALGRGLFGDVLDRYCLIWFACVLVIFSLSKTQLPHYLLYGATPLFILFGRVSRRLPAKPWLLLPGLLFVALLCALPIILPQFPQNPARPWDSGILQASIAAFDWRYSIVTAIAVLLCGIAVWLRRKVASLITLGMAQAVIVWFGVVPVLAAGQQLPTRAAAEFVRRSGENVVSYQTALPSFSVYRGAPTPRRTPQPGELAFLRADRLDELQREVGTDALQTEFRQGGVLLVRRSR